MTMMSVNTATKAYVSLPATPKRKTIVARFFDALMESRRLKAEMETRRVLAMLGRDRASYDYSLLPFRGE